MDIQAFKFIENVESWEDRLKNSPLWKAAEAHEQAPLYKDYDASIVKKAQFETNNTENMDDKKESSDNGEEGQASEEAALDTQENQEADSNAKEDQEADIDKTAEISDKVKKDISTSEGINNLIKRHPEKAEVWNKLIEDIKEAQEIINNPDSSPLEIRNAQNKLKGCLSQLKGQLFETAVKDALSDAGFDVETQQRILEGESGGTRPDVIAKNNTDQPIKVFGVVIQPGETLSIECKCGGSAYMTNQLENHIPNQLSGQEGTKVLLTTSDIKNTPSGLAEGVCKKYGANLIVLEVSVADVEKAIKEVLAA